MCEINPMYNLLNTIFDEKELVIFLGAGASREGLQGRQQFPGFDQLIDGILLKFGFDPNQKKKRFENFLTVIKKWEEQKVLSVRLHNFLEGEPGSAHYSLAALSIALFNECNALLFLTTNYDNLMSQAFNDLGKNPIRKCNAIDLSVRPNMTGLESQWMSSNILGHLKEGRPVILKLFGDLNSQCPIFRKDDMKFQPEVEKKILEWMQKPMLFIGYSFSEPILSQFLTASMGKAPVFLVNPDVNLPASIKYLDRVYHIKSDFSGFISNLMQLIKDRRSDIWERVEKILGTVGTP